MIRPAALLLALIALALLGRLDRDGILARADVVAHAVGVEFRIEMTVQRARPGALPPETHLDCAAPDAPDAPVELPPCE
jgi:hypothetical protein